MKEKDLKEHLANTLAWLKLERDDNPDFISDDALQFIAANMIGALKWASNSFDEQEFIDGVNREYDYKAYIRSKGNCMRIAKQEKII